MRFMLLVGVFLLVTGCATSPIPAERAKPASKSRLLAFQQPPAEPYGTVWVTRDTGAAGSACQVFVYIDGNHAASVWSGETARFYLPIGERIIGINTSFYCGGGLKEHQQRIVQGKTHRLRISMDTSFSMEIAPTAY